MTLTRSIVLLGGPAAGKTTLLSQMHGRMRQGSGVLREREAPVDLTVVRAGLGRLAEGLPVEHTPQGAEGVQPLPAIAADGTAVDVIVPDYDGERLRHAVRTRTLPPGWRDHARHADEWLLLVRLAQHTVPPDILTRPVAEPPATALGATADDDDLPVDMFGVELLQMLAHDTGRGSRGRRDQPRLTLVLSCWDELEVTDGERPADVAAARVPLLASHIECNWASNAARVLGVSAQGRALRDGEPDEQFIDEGPDRMGYAVLGDGTHVSDLTTLLVW